MSIRPAATVVAVLLVVGLAACGSDDEPTPEELRRERIETRLNGTFPRAQATCILDGLDDDTMIALDGDADLEPDSEALTVYSYLVRACVDDASASAPTTTTAGAGSTTTTTPDDQATEGEPASSDDTDSETTDAEVDDSTDSSEATTTSTADG